MGKIRIMHVLNTGGYSGAENVVITLINSMKDCVEGIYVSPDGSIREILEANGIKFFPICAKTVSVRELKRVIAEVKPDIIHAHDFTAGVMMAQCNSNITIINHLHNNPPWIRKICLKSMGYAISCRKFQKILTVSNSVMGEYIFGRFLKKKTHVVGNPINLQVIREKATQDSGHENYDIAFLGRLSWPKNPQLFVETIDALRSEMPSLKTVMIGDGELRLEIETLIKNLELEQNIILCGFQENPYSILKQAKVLCMPSRWEGFGLAAVEALALGKPVVAAPVGGLANIVNDSCGYLCNNKVEFVNALREVLQDSKVYEEKCVGSIERAKSFDNIQEYKNALFDIYQLLCKKV